MIYISKLFSPISTGTSAGDIDVGATVKINENGQPVDYLVVHQGLPGDMYDSSCEGTWLMRVNFTSYVVFSSTDLLPSSTLQTVANRTLQKYDEKIQEAIKQIKIPYSDNSDIVYTGESGMETKMFVLSGTEIGFSSNDFPGIPIDGAKLDYFNSGTDSAANSKRIFLFESNKQPERWNTRTSLNDRSVVSVASNGDCAPINKNTSAGVMPSFILPYSFKFKEVS